MNIILHPEHILTFGNSLTLILWLYSVLVRATILYNSLVGKELDGGVDGGVVALAGGDLVVGGSSGVVMAGGIWSTGGEKIS